MIEANTKSVIRGRKANGSPLVPAKKRPWLLISFLAMCALPTLVGSTYYGLFASDRYASKVGFTIRSVDQQGGSDLLGGLTGMASSGSTMSDAYLVISYLKSRDLVNKLQNTVDLKSILSNPRGDYFSRIDPNLTIDELRDHWERRLSVTHDTSSGVIEFEIDAFTPEHAHRISSAVLTNLRSLVNEISENARSDALRSAQSDAGLAEQKLQSVMSRLADFRVANGDIDPSSSAGARVGLLAELEARKALVETKLASLSGQLDPQSPTLLALEYEAGAIEQTMSDYKVQESGQGASRPIRLSQYETLQTEKTFAQHAYASALASLEAARAKVAAQERYLAVYQMPYIADYAAYPKRFLNSVIIFMISIMIWGISSIVVRSTKDHLT